MKPNNLFHLDIKVYIAGIRLPYQSIRITSAFNTMPTLTLSLPPDSRLYGIGRRDKVPVQVFVKDTFSKDTETSGKFLLMFEGEIDTFSYHNTAINKEFVINAQSVLSFFKDIQLRMLNDLSDHASTTYKGEDYASLLASGTLVSTLPGRLFTHGIFSEHKDPGSSEDNSIKYPFEFLENSVKYLQGIAPVQPKTALGEYYKDYTNKKINLGQRIAPIPSFDDGEGLPEKYQDVGFPILSALKSQTVLSTLAQKATDALTEGTLLDFINFVTAHLEYEVTFPNAPTPRGRAGTEEFRAPFMYLKPLMYEALPPKCNIIHRCHCTSLSTTERVYRVPTRIRTADKYGQLAALASGSTNDYLKMVGILDYYPRGGEDNSSGVPKKENTTSATLLEAEENTGPYLYDTVAPRWMAYLSPKNDPEATRQFNDDVRRHMLLLKMYEPRNMTVEMPFTPFIIQGYPAVIYDSEDTGFNFLGHVMSVEHSISEGAATTTVSMSFVRMISDEFYTATSEEDLVQRGGALHSSVKAVSDSITKNYPRITNIYENVLGCSACESYSSLLNEHISSPAQEDPTEAYQETYRRILTFEEYASLVGIAEKNESELVDAGGSLLSNRKPLYSSTGELDLVETLKEIAKTIEENGTYDTSFSI